MQEFTNFPKKESKAARNFFIIAGIIFIADTIILRFVSNWNLGIVIPAIIGAPLLIYGLFKRKIDIWFQTRTGRIIKWVFTAGYLVLTAVVAIGSIVIVNGITSNPEQKADAVIVLGAGIRGDEPSYSLKNRLNAAADYYRQNPNALLIVSGGYGNDEKYSEAYVMAKYLTEEKNIPRSKIVLEDKSSNTVENFEFSKEILDKKLGNNYRTAYVTNDFHMYRAGKIAEKAGLNTFGISAPTPALIVPNCYLRESLALLKNEALG